MAELTRGRFDTLASSRSGSLDRSSSLASSSPLNVVGEVALEEVDALESEGVPDADAAERSVFNLALIKDHCRWSTYGWTGYHPSSWTRDEPRSVDLR